MTVEELASAVLEACAQEGAQHMLTGAFATSLYGIPRSTKDVDVVLDIAGGGITGRVAARLGQIAEFDRQVQFDSALLSKWMLFRQIVRILLANAMPAVLRTRNSKSKETCI